MSRKAMWPTRIFVATVVGAFMAPSLAGVLSPDILRILSVLLIGGIVVFF